MPDQSAADAAAPGEALRRIAELEAAAAKARAALEAWDSWEGRIILDGRCWENPSGLPLITPEIWDAVIPLQEQRNEAAASLDALLHPPEGKETT